MDADDLLKNMNVQRANSVMFDETGEIKNKVPSTYNRRIRLNIIKTVIFDRKC